MNAWSRDTFITKSGFATPTGAKDGDRDVGQACANVLTDIYDKKLLAEKKAEKS